jgi:hypothetical protein
MERTIPSAFAGNAGEFFVLAELTRRGWTSALTARNNRAYDILAKRGGEFAAIRVKTKTSALTLFQWNAEPNGDIFLEMARCGSFPSFCAPAIGKAFPLANSWRRRQMADRSRGSRQRGSMRRRGSTRVPLSRRFSHVGTIADHSSW